MYQVSQNFLNQMDTRPYVARITGAAGQTGVLDTLDYSAGCTGSVFALGCGCAAAFTATLPAETANFAQGERVNLSLALQYADASEEPVPLGAFVLTKVVRETDGNTLTLAGEDAMSTTLEAEFFCADLTAPPATAAALLAEIAAGAGLTVVGAELVPAAPVSIKWDEGGGSGRTCRALVQAIALLAGANAVIDRTGALKFVRLSAAPVAAIDPGRYYESDLTVEAADFVFGALEITQTQTQTGEDGVTEEAEQVFSAQLEGETRGISCAGEWFTQSVFDGVWQAWQGKSYRPATVRFLGNILLEPGDRIAVTDRDGTVYSVPVLNIAHSFDGGVRTTVSAPAPRTEESGATAQSVSQVITGLKTELGRFKHLYTDNLTATNAALTHITTEDVTGEHGTINLKEGTFRYGDALVWDGETLTVRGALESEQGSVGGWTITDTGLSAVNGHMETSLENSAGAAGGDVGLVTQSDLDGFSVQMGLQFGPYVASDTDSGIRRALALFCREQNAAESRAAGLDMAYGNLWLTADGKIDLAAEGGVTIGGVTLGDFVVACGTSGGWSYRKYNSGLAVCTLRKYQSGLNCAAAWGNIFVTGSNSIASIAYPFTFADVPMEQIGVSKSNQGSMWIINSDLGNTAAKTGTYEFARGVSGWVDGILSYLVVGRWK